MKGLNLTDYQLVHNSGQDLWDYLFENQPLQHLYGEEEDMDQQPDWYDAGLEWISEWILTDEKWSFVEDSDKIIYTSYGRLANIERKKFKGTSMQGNTIAGNINKGAISLTKLVRETWNIELQYEDIPSSIRGSIMMTNAAKWLKEKYG
jgi:hypothetical protein